MDYENLKQKIIVLEGSIDSGKTTLGISLKDYLMRNAQGIVNAKLFVEEIDEKDLEKYINDKKKYAFTFQMSTMLNRIKVIHKAIEFTTSNDNALAIIDRGLLGDGSFARLHRDLGNISEYQLRCYEMCVNETLLCQMDRKPNLMIMLSCDMQTLLARIKCRGRQCEKAYDESYLNTLINQHEILANDTMYYENRLNLTSSGNSKGLLDDDTVYLALDKIIEKLLNYYDYSNNSYRYCIFSI
jgi:deoxyadenosine/deoxycytidine kinase